MLWNLLQGLARRETSRVLQNELHLLFLPSHRFKNVGLCSLIVAVFAIVAVTAHDIHPFSDIVPGLAQIKSVFQLITGDVEGAGKTQLNYLNDGIGPSQARSVFYLAAGEPKKAGDVQEKFLSNVEGLVDAIRIIVSGQQWEWPEI